MRIIFKNVEEVVIETDCMKHVEEKKTDVEEVRV